MLPGFVFWAKCQKAYSHLVEISLKIMVFPYNGTEPDIVREGSRGNCSAVTLVGVVVAVH